ncbi:natural killer cells antigen CD94-like isoform X2 [Choloepus didactylus]|nr:natural killer cells antigen CD94-like isoform X2 [Choloepus didactylus]
MAAFQNVPWRLISGILGIICLFLVSTLGILLKISFTKQIAQSTFSSGPTIGPQKVSGCCSCHEKWIGYQCNCYFFSDEEKSWKESSIACASQNSSLLQLESRDELGFLINHRYFYWIGLSYSEARGSWFWEDGSALSPNLFSSSQTLNPRNCIMYKPNSDVLNEDCMEKNYYICKQQLQVFHGVVGG